MENEAKLTIPKYKINGERIGQLIYNAIKKRWLEKHGNFDDEILADNLWSYENDELQEVIDEYLNEKM